MSFYQNTLLDDAPIAAGISAPEINTVATTPNIPLEICDIIIDLLEDDKGALKNLSLTCYAWSKRAHRHLFHELPIRERHITAGDSGSPFERWKNVMLKTLLSETLSFVRYVYLRGINEFEVLRVGNVLDVIQALPRLETLSIYKLGLDDLHACQTAKPIPTVTVLTIAFPYMQRRLRTAILYFIALFPSLNTLTLCGIGAELGLDPLPRPMLPHSRPLQCLQHLRLLEDCVPIFALVDAIGYLSSPNAKLRILTLDSVRDSKFPSITTIMRHSGPHLYELQIEMGVIEAVTDSTFKIPGMSLCTNLRLLHLSVYKSKAHWFRYLRRSLATVSSNYLEHIEVDIPFTGQDLLEIFSKDWQGLTPIMCSFPALKEVVVNVIPTNAPVDSDTQKIITRGLQLGLGCYRNYVLQVAFSSD